MRVAESPTSTASSDRAAASVFPLPLTTMEEFMIVDSTPHYPMMCDLELTFQGRIDREAFEHGLEFALGRNLLFRSTIRRLPSGQRAWHPCETRPVVQWVSLEAPLDDSYGAPADFVSQPGLRVWVRQGDNESRVLLHFHHACADAIGGFGFIEDFLVGYHNATPDSVPIEPRPLEPERLLTRGEIGMGGRSWWRQFTDVFAGAREGIKFFAQRPAPLAAVAGSEGGVSPRPSFVTTMLSDEVSGSLRRLASESGATTNDLLMRELFIALARWNRAQGGLSARRRLRILMPQNLRERDDYMLPLTNAMSFAFVTRKSGWCERPAAMLDSLREETEAVRKGKLSLYFLGGLGSIRSAGLLKPVLRGPFCFATAVLSNLGEPSRRFVTPLPRVSGGVQAGNLIFQHVLGVPPTRPNTHVVFTIANHGPAISVTSKWDHHRYNPTDGRRIHDDYVAQLESTAREFSSLAARAAAAQLTMMA